MYQYNQTYTTDLCTFSSTDYLCSFFHQLRLSKFRLQQDTKLFKPFEGSLQDKHLQEQ